MFYGLHQCMHVTIPGMHACRMDAAAAPRSTQPTAPPHTSKQISTFRTNRSKTPKVSPTTSQREHNGSSGRTQTCKKEPKNRQHSSSSPMAYDTTNTRSGTLQWYNLQNNFFSLLECFTHSSAFAYRPNHAPLTLKLVPSAATPSTLPPSTLQICTGNLSSHHRRYHSRRLVAQQPGTNGRIERAALLICQRHHPSAHPRNPPTRPTHSHQKLPQPPRGTTQP